MKKPYTPPILLLFAALRTISPALFDLESADEVEQKTRMLGI
ncbi:MAG: hypothetical protein ABSF80_00825 [Chitinispirillaceae bacterium]|jgi:hypothetical protein